jgi:hypothetical protein
MSDYTSIPLKRETAEQLDSEKNYGETWDQFVRRRLGGE